MREAPAARPVIFGEILFDCFPDGASRLGGAPFNVAWHLQGLGARPLFIGRIGDDAAGEAVQAVMEEWGMDRRGLQLDECHPTGVVEVSLEGGQPSYHIVPEQAYDFVDRDAAVAALEGSPAALLYHGTLALRNPVSRRACEALRSHISAPVCVDLNLRAPWWDSAMVHEVLHGAQWVKLNDEELAEVSLPPPASGGLEDAARALRQRYGLECLVVTLGAEGAWMVTEEEFLRGAPVAVEKVVDTVGAGDAFAAVGLLGVLRGWPLSLTLARALEFAARLCAVRGATIQDRAFYDSQLARWETSLD
ncbi:MAG TPA: carbohydrate kinase [Gammaproteobacteria bacterium]|nr:carbohydrate kinase [Gammaproteobacteria bacterium]